MKLLICINWGGGGRGVPYLSLKDASAAPTGFAFIVLLQTLDLGKVHAFLFGSHRLWLS